MIRGLCLLLFVQVGLAQETRLYVNPRIWTGDLVRPWAGAMAVQGEKIIDIGDAEKLTARHANAQVIEIEGGMIVPGFIDNHTHFAYGGRVLTGVKTLAAANREAFVRIISEFAADKGADEWITGGQWDHERWGGELPTREWVDEATGGRPLFLIRTDGHMGLANSKALELAKITKDTPDPVGGVIVRDGNGEPTGVLKDRAMFLVRMAIPPLSEARMRSMLKACMDEAARYGVTLVHDMCSWRELELYRKVKAEGGLKIRISAYPPISERQRLATLINAEGKGDARLRWGGVKAFADGSLGSTTAWFYEPYADAPDTSGFPLMPVEMLEKELREAHQLGLQVAVHGIGDRANDTLLDIFEKLKMKRARPRIEHAQHLTPQAFKRFKALGVIPSMQPYHAIDDGRWAEKRIGEDRLSGAFAFRSLLDAGATLTFGSDWAVAPLDPIKGIDAAVNRRTLDGENQDGWVPRQRITVGDALRAYTVHNAWAGKLEGQVGTLGPGKQADFVVLSQDLFDVNRNQIGETQVLMTVVGGEVVYRY